MTDVTANTKMVQIIATAALAAGREVVMERGTDIVAVTVIDQGVQARRDYYSSIAGRERDIMKYHDTWADAVRVGAENCVQAARNGFHLTSH